MDCTFWFRCCRPLLCAVHHLNVACPPLILRIMYKARFNIDTEKKESTGLTATTLKNNVTVTTNHLCAADNTRRACTYPNLSGRRRMRGGHAAFNGSHRTAVA
eukprot:scpid106042/ scgid7422/ 